MVIMLMVVMVVMMVLMVMMVMMMMMMVMMMMMMFMMMMVMTVLTAEFAGLAKVRCMLINLRWEDTAVVAAVRRNSDADVAADATPVMHVNMLYGWPPLHSSEKPSRLCHGDKAV